MKIKLRFFKPTGKWNYDEEVLIDKEDFTWDFNEWAIKNYGHKEGFVYISTIEGDGHEQPVRIVVLNSVKLK